MTDEGYIKFEARWTQRPAYPLADIQVLNAWRQRCVEKGWIGAYPNGIGFGNISRRWDAGGKFLITGSATGHLDMLTPAHYARVEHTEPANNMLWCTGPVIASSESMSHAAIYQQCPDAEGVIHIHHKAMWTHLCHAGIATSPAATYGSPEMVDAIIALLQLSEFRSKKIFAMAGHEDGVFAFGSSLEEAFRVLEDAL